MTNRNYKVCLLLILLTAVFTAQNAYPAEEEFHNTYKVDPGTEVNVRNINGSVNVIGWDEDYVDVYAVKSTRVSRDELDLVMIDVTVNGIMDIRTEIVRPDDYEDSFFRRLFHNIYHRSPKVNVAYTIKLPHSVILAEAVNTNGNVEVEGTTGDSILRTTNGNVIVENTDGMVEAKSTNGSIKIINGAVTRSARTTNGSITAAISGNFIDDTSISTTNGSIRLIVPESINAEIELNTVNGSINLNGIRMMVDNISKRNVTGELGNGGKRINARTINGNITIEQD